MPEFPRQVLDSLRQPIETGEAVVARANAHVTYPARFQLVAARNPCPCGYHGADDDAHPCLCHPGEVSRYQRRLSGPLLDRLDLRVHVPRLSEAELLSATPGEASEVVASRVAAARFLALERQGVPNAYLSGRALSSHALLEPTGEAVLGRIVRSRRPTARGLDRLLRVARTVADLNGSAGVNGAHLLEASSYRDG
jgi:magnesium chelatase family protein